MENGEANKKAQELFINAPKDVNEDERIAHALYYSGYNIAYNELTNDIEVNGSPLEDKLLSCIILQMHRYHFKQTLVEHVIRKMALENSYHPIREFFTSMDTSDFTPEHTPKLDEFLNNLTIQDPEVTLPVVKKWLVGVVAKLFVGHQNFALVLEGVQGSGKTTLARWVSIKPEWFYDGDVNPESKDCLLSLSSFLIWEMGELARITSKKDANALKDFLTKDKITVRPAYGKYPITRKALASFIGTVNNNQYLIDTTGNRRYFPIFVENINFDYQYIDKNELWKEIYGLFLSGFDYELTSIEKAYQKEKNEEKMAEDIIGVTLAQIISEAPTQTFLPTSKIVEELKNMGFMINTIHPRKIADFMVSRGFKDARRRIGNQQIRGYAGCRLDLLLCSAVPGVVSNDQEEKPEIIKKVSALLPENDPGIPF